MALRERRTRRGRPMARHEAQLQHTVGMLVFALTLPVFAFLSLPLLAPVCAVCAVLAAGTAVLCMVALMVVVHAITSQDGVAHDCDASRWSVLLPCCLVVL